MATNESWTKVVKEISPILSKTVSHKKKANKKEIILSIIVGGIAIVGLILFAFYL